MPSSSTSSDSSSRSRRVRGRSWEPLPEKTSPLAQIFFCSSVTGRERGGDGWRQQETNKNLIIVGLANASRLTLANPFISLVIFPRSTKVVFFPPPWENTPWCFLINTTLTDFCGLISLSRIQHRGWLTAWWLTLFFPHPQSLFVSFSFFFFFYPLPPVAHPWRTRCCGRRSVSEAGGKDGTLHG